MTRFRADRRSGGGLDRRFSCRYFPSFLEPRRRSEQALVSFVQEAYVAGVLYAQGRPGGRVAGAAGLEERGLAHLSGLDEQVEAVRQRPLEGRYSYLWLDAKVEKVRDGGRVVRKCWCSPTVCASPPTGR
jgi:putative transposase